MPEPDIARAAMNRPIGPHDQRSQNSWSALMASRFGSVCRAVLGLAGAAMLSGCIYSTQPILDDAKPVFGPQPRLQFYGVSDGLVDGPETRSYRWDGKRYVLAGGPPGDYYAFSVHELEGADFIVQGQAKPDKAYEYLVARKAMDGVYTVFPVDEDDADEATRTKLCLGQEKFSCRVETREAVVAIARATAAKEHKHGGLALVMKPKDKK
jgi:hypothetical protein